MGCFGRIRSWSRLPRLALALGGLSCLAAAVPADVHVCTAVETVPWSVRFGPVEDGIGVFVGTFDAAVDRAVPKEGVRVRLRALGSPTETELVTDAKGRVKFDEPVSRLYDLTVERSGSLLETFRYDGTTGESFWLWVGPSPPAHHILCHTYSRRWIRASLRRPFGEARVHVSVPPNRYEKLSLTCDGFPRASVQYLEGSVDATFDAPEAGVCELLLAGRHVRPTRIILTPENLK